MRVPLARPPFLAWLERGLPLVLLDHPAAWVPPLAPLVLALVPGRTADGGVPPSVVPVFAVILLQVRPVAPFPRLMRRLARPPRPRGRVVHHAVAVAVLVVLLLRLMLVLLVPPRRPL